LSQLILLTSFSCGESLLESGDTVSQTIHIENRFNCECVVKLDAKLVDIETETIQETTLCYDGSKTDFTQLEVISRYARKSGRRAQKHGNSNPRKLTRMLTAGSPPHNSGRPYQVFGVVEARATESINGQSRKGGLWEPPVEAQSALSIK
jgi:hypothetical protein